MLNHRMRGGGIGPMYPGMHPGMYGSGTKTIINTVYIHNHIVIWLHYKHSNNC